MRRPIASGIAAREHTEPPTSAAAFVPARIENEERSNSEESEDASAGVPGAAGCVLQRVGGPQVHHLLPYHRNPGEQAKRLPLFDLSYADFAALMRSGMPSFSLGFPRWRWSCSLFPTMASPSCFPT